MNNIFDCMDALIFAYAVLGDIWRPNRSIHITSKLMCENISAGDMLDQQKIFAFKMSIKYLFTEGDMR